MLTYTFSTREKIMIAILVVVVVGLAWYQFIFSNIQSQIQTIDGEIANVQDQYTITQSRVASYTEMRTAVANFEAQGLEPVAIPSFDNTQNLMAYLNGVLANSDDYSMSFSSPYLSEDDSMIHRDGSIQFRTSSYELAHSISENISRGIYPCRVQAMSIAESTRRTSSGGSASYTTNMDVTFLENPNGEEAPTEEDDGIPEGNDWSVMKEVL